MRSIVSHFIGVAFFNLISEKVINKEEKGEKELETKEHEKDDGEERKKRE